MRIKSTQSLLNNLLINPFEISKIAKSLGENEVKNVNFLVDRFNLIYDKVRIPIPSNVKCNFDKVYLNSAKYYKEIHCDLDVIIYNYKFMHEIDISGSMFIEYRGDDKDIICMDALYSYLCSIIESNRVLNEVLVYPIKLPDSIESLCPVDIGWSYSMSKGFIWSPDIKRIKEERKPKKSSDIFNEEFNNRLEAAKRTVAGEE